jgi:serine protease Do
LELGSSDTVRIGQTVVAIGNSLGEFSDTVTKGVISGINRRVTANDGSGGEETLESVIQTDAAINPGNSGGPLLNVGGQVIGINTAVSQQGQSIGFAIPINDAVQLIHSIEKYGKVVRPYLGVRYVVVDKQLQRLNDLTVDHGALLRRGENPGDLSVIPGSPADKAGLQENDIILEIDGTKIDESNSLVRLLGKYQPGDSVKMKVLKDGKEQDISVTLGQFDDKNQPK